MFQKARPILFLVLLLASPISQARLLEKVYAVVNGETITLTETKDYQEKLKTGGFVNDLLFSDPEVREKAANDEKFLLEMLIDEKLIDYEVKANGMQITEERVDKEVESVAKRQNMTVTQLRETLEQQGVDYLEYRDFVKKSIERRQLVEKEITSKIKISEQDIVSHYLSNNTNSKSQIYEFTIAHILLNKEDQSKAQDVQKKLKAGTSFESLVTQYSTDEGSKGEQGKFGSFKSGEMMERIEKAIIDLKIGETSKTVETPMGLHVFKILDRKLIKDPNIERQKQEIYQKLFAQAFKEQLDFWLTQKKKDAIIQINNS